MKENLENDLIEDKNACDDVKNDSKSSHVYLTQPSDDLNIYMVDKFHPPMAISKQVPHESIDLSKPSAKCLGFTTSESSPDELLLVITLFITTGRILVQGKGHEDWSKHEFPALLDIVNQLSFLKSFSDISSVEDKSIFTGSVHNFFGNFVPDDDIPSLSHSVDIANRGTSPPFLLTRAKRLTIIRSQFPRRASPYAVGPIHKSF
ncbi:unnamed protein product [Porites evermanni]|uniref:Uncharacterized protein n=1 Tax=Porites evermanni TaxID=104178 RepID=A0ABN8M0R9_9CNID|nr:unnamed protein product [Porites evermanni]